MQLVIEPGGRIRALYSEALDFTMLGRLDVVRASYVEPGPDGRWYADLRLVLGPLLGPFDRRSQALEAEVAWLEANWLLPRHRGASPSDAAPAAKLCETRP
jgi:hypothetical protein